MMKTLRMKFATDLGNTYTLSMSYAKDGLTADEVEAAMQVLMDGDIFDAPFDGIVGAEVVDRTVTELL